MTATGRVLSTAKERREVVLSTAVSSFAQASEPAVREVVQRGYTRTVEHVRSVSGADADAVQHFMARGALCHPVVTIGAIEIDAPWADTLSAGLRHY